MNKINKIVLIRPGKYPEGLIVPLGLLYLAAYIKQKRPNIEIIIIDAALKDYGPEEIAGKVKSINPEIVGLTGLHLRTKDIMDTAAHIRKALPSTIIIAGGAAVSSNYEQLLLEKSINFGVIGEGEKTFYEIIKAVEAEEEISKLEGLAYKNNAGAIIRTQEREVLGNLDEIPFPAYDLISVEEYFTGPKRNTQSSVYISKRNLPIMTSRGCPYHCIFCHKIMGKMFRPRSVENVIKEIIFLKRTYDIKELEFIDDIFNFDLNRAKLIFKRIIEEKLDLNISFPSGVKYEMIDDELLDLFKKAGVYRLAFGIESANHEIQRKIGKFVDLKKMSAIIDKASQMGFFTSGFFQLGIPGETREQMLETINYAIASKLHTAMFHFTIPFPGTQMYEEHVKGKTSCDHFISAREISINLSAVSDKEMIKLKNYAFCKFYLSPVRILSIYKAFPVKTRLFYNFINVISEILFKKWIINT
jgi:radical SAM superfamily enzyme YgiQ (UPF0313 family)